MKMDKLEGMYLPNLSTQAGCDTRSVFKGSFTGLNSEFLFLSSCFAKVKEPNLPYNLFIAEGKIVGFIPFLWIFSAMQNANSFIQDLNSGHCVHHAQLLKWQKVK